MSRINRVPKGFLDFLGTQNQGDNPSELMQDVRPSIDLFPFFAAERVSLFSDSVNSAGALDGVTFVVPDGEVWFPLFWSGRYSIAANGDTCDLHLSVTKPANGQQNPAEASTIRNVIQSAYFTGATTTAGEQLDVTYTFPMLVSFGTGSEFVANFREATTAVLSTFRAALWYYKFSV